jgi:alpha-glucoside transport system permease protein
MDPKIIQFAIVLVFVPAAVVGYILLIERVLGFLPGKQQPRLRPWLWLAPAFLFLTIFLIYPMVQTVIRSLSDKLGTNFVGLLNYQYIFTNGDSLASLRNSLIWLVLLTILAVGSGLLVAILFDRVRYEALAKALVFMPLAISFVGAGVIWKFMFDYKPSGATQIGTLNASLTSFGFDPVAWLQNAPLNTLMLIIVATWIWTGFCMVILSGALKGISTELLEAARVDGATELQVFRTITFPLLLPTIAVVSTTMIITALKAFDIVYVMTGGNFDTNIVALRMYQQLSTNDTGRASALAVVLLACTLPVMFYNIRRFREQEAQR